MTREFSSAVKMPVPVLIQCRKLSCITSSLDSNENYLKLKTSTTQDGPYNLTVTGRYRQILADAIFKKPVIALILSKVLELPLPNSEYAVFKKNSVSAYLLPLSVYFDFLKRS